MHDSSLSTEGLRLDRSDPSPPNSGLCGLEADRRCVRAPLCTAACRGADLESVRPYRLHSWSPAFTCCLAACS